MGHWNVMFEHEHELWHCFLTVLGSRQLPRRCICVLNAWHAQAAIDVSGLGDTSVDPAEVSSYHFKLGRVLWETKAKGAHPKPETSSACVSRR